MDSRQQVLGGRAGRHAGFTLMEALIATTLVGVMMASFYAFLLGQGTESFEEGSELRIQEDMRRTMAAVIDELKNARLSYLDSSGAFVRYQVPKTGDSGAPELDGNGDLVFGAYDTTHGAATWLPGGYYEMSFVDSTRPEDNLRESELATGNNDQGQNLDQSYTKKNNENYGDAFIYGQFQVLIYSSAGSMLDVLPAQETGKIGLRQMLPGRILRQYPYDSKTETASPTTSPDGGGFFYLRQPAGLLLYPSSGAKKWGPQSSETFAKDGDGNNNGIFEPELDERIVDANNNGTFEEPDSEAFIDADGNNVLSGVETYSDENGNGSYDGRLRVQLRVFDQRKVAARSEHLRFNYATIRMLTTKIKLRNQR